MFPNDKHHPLIPSTRMWLIREAAVPPGPNKHHVPQSHAHQSVSTQGFLAHRCHTYTHNKSTRLTHSACHIMSTSSNSHPSESQSYIFSSFLSFHYLQTSPIFTHLYLPNHEHPSIHPHLAPGLLHHRRAHKEAELQSSKPRSACLIRTACRLHAEFRLGFRVSRVPE